MSYRTKVLWRNIVYLPLSKLQYRVELAVSLRTSHDNWTFERPIISFTSYVSCSQWGPNQRKHFRKHKLSSKQNFVIQSKIKVKPPQTIPNEVVEQRLSVNCEINRTNEPHNSLDKIKQVVDMSVNNILKRVKILYTESKKCFRCNDNTFNMVQYFK